MVMPKGQQKKVAGAICNVPVICHQTCNVLPRPPERSGIIMLELHFKKHDTSVTDDTYSSNSTQSEDNDIEETDDPDE